MKNYNYLTVDLADKLFNWNDGDRVGCGAVFATDRYEACALARSYALVGFTCCLALNFIYIENDGLNFKKQVCVRAHGNEENVSSEFACTRIR